MAGLRDADGALDRAEAAVEVLLTGPAPSTGRWARPRLNVRFDAGAAARAHGRGRAIKMLRIFAARPAIIGSSSPRLNSP